MKVLRMQEIETNEYKEGDQLSVGFDGIGIFTATMQINTDAGALFMFDKCIIDSPMNLSKTNVGGYVASSLGTWVRYSLPAKITDKDLALHVVKMDIPTYGQIFGHDDWYEEYLKGDNDAMFPLMNEPKNRITDINKWYWLQNETLSEPDSFAVVFGKGDGYYNIANEDLGVRPIMIIR